MTLLNYNTVHSYGFFTTQSTVFQLCWDGPSCIEPVLSKDLMCVLLKDTNSHEIFQIFGRFQIFSFHIFISKVCGFHLQVTKILFWTGGVGGFRLFMAYFRFFHAELSLMLAQSNDTGEGPRSHKMLSSTLYIM